MSTTTSKTCQTSLTSNPSLFLALHTAIELSCPILNFNATKNLLKNCAWSANSLVQGANQFMKSTPGGDFIAFFQRLNCPTKFVFIISSMTADSTFLQHVKIIFWLFQVLGPRSRMPVSPSMEKQLHEISGSQDRVTSTGSNQVCILSFCSRSCLHQAILILFCVLFKQWSMFPVM